MANKKYNKEVANTIYRQLGGRRFTVMTGSKNFVYDSESGRPYLRMDLARNKSGANRLQIYHDAGSDLYEMRFYTLRKKRNSFDYEVKEVETHEGVYASMLPELFEKTTGLYVKF